MRARALGSRGARLLLSERVEERLMRKEDDVLGKEVGGVASLELLLRLARIHALEDAELAEVLEWYLQLRDGLGACHVLRYFLLHLANGVAPLEFLLVFDVAFRLLALLLASRLSLRSCKHTCEQAQESSLAAAHHGIVARFGRVLVPRRGPAGLVLLLSGPR